MESHVTEFITSRAVCTVATCSNDTPHAVPVYYHFDPAHSCFYFVTKSETAKITNITENKVACVTIYDESPQTTFTAHCEAEVLDGESPDFIAITNRLIAVHASQEYYPTPLHMLEEGTLRLVKLIITKHTFDRYIQRL